MDPPAHCDVLQLLAVDEQGRPRAEPFATDAKEMDDESEDDDARRV